jgi:hypothetical protein
MTWLAIAGYFDSGANAFVNHPSCAITRKVRGWSISNFDDSPKICHSRQQPFPSLSKAVPEKRYQTKPLQLKAIPAQVASVVKAMHGDSTYVLTAILWLSSFGISLEKRTTIGKALSAPLATMALALTIANLGIIPFSSPICTFLWMLL